MLSFESNQVLEFLGNFKTKSTVEIVEGSSKEMKDLVASAKKRGILAEGSKDLGLIKTIYCFTDRANDNGDVVPSKEFQKKFPQIVGKPMNIGHNRTLIVGVYIDYKYIVKENTAIAYATFFKSIYPKLWEKAKKLKKANKLSSSFEIWSPEDKREYLADGTCKLRQMEIAGGALIFEEKGDTPAFRDAKALAIAKTQVEKELIGDSLVYASKYKDRDIIVADKNYFKDSVEENYKKLQAEQVQNQPEKIKCSNCEKEFETLEKLNIKCPNCFAVVNQEGSMIYPPQIIDFKILCPNCNINNWLVLSNKEDKARLKCQGCAKEYETTFAKIETDELLSKTPFIFTGYAICPQCNHRNSIEGSSKAEEFIVNCKTCGLEFKFNRSKSEQYKKIATISEIIEEPKKKEESSEEGGEKEMEIPEKIVEKVKEEDKKKEQLEQKPSSSEEKIEKEETPTKSKTEPIKSISDEMYKSMAKQVDKELALVEAAKTKQQQRGKVIFPYESSKVTDKKDHFPINDANQARNALARVAQYSVVPSWYKGTLIELQRKVRNMVTKEYPSIKVTKSSKAYRKAIKKIKTLEEELVKLKEKKESLTSAVKKTASFVISLKEEVKKINKESEKKINLYKENAKLIISRKEELGNYGENLSDEDILNNDKFEVAKLKKENDLLKSSKDKDSIVVSVKPKAKEEDISNAKKEIDSKAFGKVKRNQ